MIARERVKAAIAHQETDRPPYVFDPLDDVYAKIQSELGIKDVDAWLDNDVEKIGAGTQISSNPGVRRDFVCVPWWDWNWSVIGPEWRAEDPPAGRPPTIGCGSYEGLAARFKALRRMSDKYFLVRCYGGIFERACGLRGMENFLVDLCLHKEFAIDLCRVIVEKQLAMLENFLSIPEIDGVLLGDDLGTQQNLFMSVDTWEEVIAPCYEREFPFVKSCGKDVWMHSCGAIESVIPRLIELGVEVLNPLQQECFDVLEIKKKYGDKLSFWGGGISTQKTFPFGTPEEVREEATRIRRAMSQGGGYIFASSQDIQADVPVENIAAMLEVAKSKM
jgi:uroporphyrinogen decarboxylase